MSSPLFSQMHFMAELPPHAREQMMRYPYREVSDVRVEEIKSAAQENFDGCSAAEVQQMVLDLIVVRDKLYSDEQTGR